MAAVLVSDGSRRPQGHRRGDGAATAAAVAKTNLCDVHLLLLRVKYILVESCPSRVLRFCRVSKDLEREWVYIFFLLPALQPR